MANNKYVFASNIATGKSISPTGTLLTDGWDPEDGTQVPDGTNMNFMHRQLSMSNDFWHEVPVDLSGTNTFTITESITSIGTGSSFPAESLLFNVTARGGTPRAQAIFVTTTNAFGDWPIGRSFWVRNNVANRAVFVSLPDIAANVPSIPAAITGIFKILVPGQYCKFRVIGQGSTRQPYLALEYDSHWVDSIGISVGASSITSNPSSPLTANTINEYYNGHSYCARAQIIGTCNARATGNMIPAANYTTYVVDGFNVAKNSLFPILQNRSSGAGFNDGRISAGNDPIFPNLYDGYPDVAATRTIAPGLWYYFDVGDPDPASSETGLGLTGMRMPNPVGFIATAPTNEANTNIFQLPRAIQITRSLSCLAYTQTSGSADDQRQSTATFRDGGTIVGHSPRASAARGWNTVVACVTMDQSDIAPLSPVGQFIDNLYVIYPNPANGNATTAGYF